MPPLEQVIPLFLVLVLSLSFHEAAHAWTANRMGDPTARELGRLTLNPLAHIDPIGTVLFPLIAMISGIPLIGWAKPVPVNPRYFPHPQQGFAVVALAGPVSNLILATAGAVVWHLLPHAGGLTAVPYLPELVLQFVVINVLLAVFNMIPVPPLDGGNVLIGLLPVSAARMVGRLRPYGFVILVVLLYTGVITWITMPIRNLLVEWLL